MSSVDGGVPNRWDGVQRERATENYFAEAFSVVHPASFERLREPREV